MKSSETINFHLYIFAVQRSKRFWKVFGYKFLLTPNQLETFIGTMYLCELF